MDNMSQRITTKCGIGAVVAAVFLVVCLAVLESPCRAQLEDEYLPVYKTDLSFGVSMVFTSLSNDSDGNILAAEGDVKRFTFAGKIVPLRSKPLVVRNGELFISTKDLGDVKVTSSYGSRTLWVTPSQMKLFQAFRKKPAPSEYGERVIVHKFASGEVAFAPDGKSLAIGMSGGAGQGEIGVYDATTCKTLRSFSVDAGVLDLSYSPDGRMLASGHIRGPHVCIWDVEEGRQVAKFEAGDFGRVNAQIQIVESTAPSSTDATHFSDRIELGPCFLSLMKSHIIARESEQDNRCRVCHENGWDHRM
jgi:WD40 repeat protein